MNRKKIILLNRMEMNRVMNILKRIKMPLMAVAALQGATASIVRTAFSPNLLESMESFTDSAFEGTPCASFDLGEVTTSSDERYTGPTVFQVKRKLLLNTRLVGLIFHDHRI